MIKQKTIHITVTNNFSVILNEFFNEIEANKEFKALLKEKIKKDKRLEEKGKRHSLKIRFAVAFALREIRKQKTSVLEEQSKQ